MKVDDGLRGSANQSCVIDAGESFESYTFAMPLDGDATSARSAAAAARST